MGTDIPGDLPRRGDLRRADKVMSTEAIKEFLASVHCGRIGIVSNPDVKQRFFTAFMKKYAPQDSWGRPKDTFPRIDSTILYSIVPEIMTGKQTPLPAVEKRWRRADLPVDASS